MSSDYASDTGTCQALLAKRKSPRPLSIYIGISTIEDMKEKTFDDKAAELRRCQGGGSGSSRGRCPGGD